MAKPVADADTILLVDFDEATVPGTGYATLVDSIGARNLTETNGGAGARSANYTHIINAGGVAGRLARWFPGKTGGNAAFLSRAGDASSTSLLVGSYTLRFWVCPDSLASEIIAYTGPSETTADNALLQLTVLGTGLLSIFWEFSTGTNVTTNQTTGTGLAVGIWRHVAITVDNSGATSTIKIYVAGTLQQTITGVTKATGGSTATWFIGCSGTSPASGFLGAVTGLCIDSVVRTGTEITTYAGLGASVAAPTDGSTFVGWHCQEQPDAFDKSPFGRHLRKVGAGAIEAVDSLIIGDAAGKARHLDGTVEYIGRWGDEALRLALIGDNTLALWWKGETGYAANLTGFGTFGDWTTENLADNAYSWDLQTSLIFRILTESGSGTDVAFAMATALFATLAEGYNRNFLTFVKKTAGGSNNTVESWKNGALAASVTVAGNFAGGTTDYFRLGVGSGSTPHPLLGTLDGVHLQKRALTGPEILAAFQANAPVVTLVTPAAGSTIGPFDKIKVNFTDGDLDLTSYTPAFNSELAWNGAAHTAAFSTSTRTTLGTGFQHLFSRDAGFPVGPLELSGTAFDATGLSTPFTFNFNVVGAAETVSSPTQAAATAPILVGDIALIWDGESADMAIANDDIAFEPGLRTAVLLSLFTDKRAEPDDQIPDGTDDRRGYWADQFAEVEGDLHGSRLWLVLDRSAQRENLPQQIDAYSREALAWMIEDKVVESIEVIVEQSRGTVFWQVDLKRPGKDPFTMRFAYAWDGEAAR